ncbi:MAG: redoxin domain-containing protein [Candidatus Rokubacteria bacterium]|nr:redoxin domain-containing protein [Candidatus Rokubacteria bacterium]MBI2878248.1 redoxin domain-containing protein [Candidatus Rokubacteria bacterium]
MRHSRQSRKKLQWLSRRSRRRLKVVVILGLFVTAAGAGAWWWTSRPGEPAPAFALPASTGQTVRVEDFRGKQPVVLVFYMAGT